ncbi:hypothetical protein TYRP_012360, partial [Tyrophagus putrescentiae]
MKPSNLTTVAPVTTTTTISWEKVTHPATDFPLSIPSGKLLSSTSSDTENQLLNPIPLENNLHSSGSFARSSGNSHSNHTTTTTTTTTEAPEEEEEEEDLQEPLTTHKVPLEFELPATNSPFFENSEEMEIKKSELLEDDTPGRPSSSLVSSSAEMITTTTTTTTTTLSPQSNFITLSLLDLPSVNSTSTSTTTLSPPPTTTTTTTSTPSNITTTTANSTVESTLAEQTRPPGFFRRIPQRISKMRSYLSNRFL